MVVIFLFGQPDIVVLISDRFSTKQTECPSRPFPKERQKVPFLGKILLYFFISSYGGGIPKVMTFF